MASKHPTFSAHGPARLLTSSFQGTYPSVVSVHPGPGGGALRFPSALAGPYGTHLELYSCRGEERRGPWVGPAVLP